MGYKQANNPLSRKTSPLLRTSPLNEAKPIELETVDLGTIKSTNPRPPVRSVVEDVTSTILELQGS